MSDENKVPSWDETEEVADVPQFEDTVDLEASAPEVEDVIGDSTRGLMGGGAGAAVGYGLDAGVKFAGDKIMNYVGDLKADEIQKISDNRDIYKTVNPLQDMLEQFRSLGDSNRTKGINAAAQARESLKGQAPIPVTDVYKTLATPAENPKYSTELAPDKASELLGDELDRAYPTLEDKQAAMLKSQAELADVENQINAPFVDERAEINQAAKEAQHNRKLEQLSAPLPENKKIPVIDQFQEQKDAQRLQGLDSRLEEVKNQNTQSLANQSEDLAFNRQLEASKDGKLREIDVERNITPDWEKIEVVEGYKNDKVEHKLNRVDEKIAKAEDKIAQNIQKVEQKKQAFQQELANRKDKTSAIRNIDKENAEAKVNARKDQIEFNKLIADEKAAQIKNLKEQERLEKLLEQKKSIQEKQAKIQQKIERTVNKAAEKADSSLQSIKQAPAEIRQVSPFLENRVLGEDYAKTLEDSISDIRNSETIDPVRLDQKLQEIRDNVPEGKSNTVGKFNAELSTAVKDDLQNRFPDYKEGMGKASESFKTEALFDKLGIAYNKDLDRVTLEKSGSNKLTNILQNPKDYPQEYAYLQEALKDSEKNGSIALPEQLLKEAEVSALKAGVDNLRGGKALNPFEINAAVKGDVSRLPSMFSKLGGTRLQEMYALFKESKAANMLKNTSKVGATLGGGLIGMSTAANAASEGKISPEQLAATSTAEFYAPPMTSPTDSVIEGNKAYADALNQGDHEAMANLKALGGSISGFTKPLTQGLSSAVPAVDEMLEGGFKAVRNTLNATGMEQSNAARDRKAQNFQALKEPKLNEDFKTFVEQKPEQIADLASLFSADENTKAFVGPLEKAAQGDERTRSAVLFGLYQQPAFRQALKKKN